MTVLGLDPGTDQSALVGFDGHRIVSYVTEDNARLNERLGTMPMWETVLVVERIASMGMPVGDEVFHTVWWTGRFAETWLRRGGTYETLTRHVVKMHLCESPRAKDTHIRQSLYNRFGPGRDRAVGRKDAPGPLYGLRDHEYAALAVAVTWLERSR